jgi:hypothetical protein
MVACNHEKNVKIRNEAKNAPAMGWRAAAWKGRFSLFYSALRMWARESA